MYSIVLGEPSVEKARTRTNSAPTVLAANRAFGTATVDIGAPGENHNLLESGGGIKVCSGTSFAAPLVAGTIGLMIANVNGLQGNPAQIRNRLLCNATPVPGMAGQIGNGGALLNVNAAVTNAVAGCP